MRLRLFLLHCKLRNKSSFRISEGKFSCEPHWDKDLWWASLLTYLLTPWCRVLLEKLAGLQLVKKFTAFYGTRRFITAFTSFRHSSLSWASPIQSPYPQPTWNPAPYPYERIAGSQALSAFACNCSVTMKMNMEHWWNVADRLKPRYCKGRFTHSMPCPCRSAKGLECVFPIWFTQCNKATTQHGRLSTAVLCCGLEKNGMVGAWHGHGMASVNQTRPHCVNQMEKTPSKPLTARRGSRTVWARHAMCESAFKLRWTDWASAGGQLWRQCRRFCSLQTPLLQVSQQTHLHNATWRTLQQCCENFRCPQSYSLPLFLLSYSCAPSSYWFPEWNYPYKTMCACVFSMNYPCHLRHETTAIRL